MFRARIKITLIIITIGFTLGIFINHKQANSNNPIDNWISLLKSKDAKIRYDASYSLNKETINSKVAATKLTKALKDPNPFVRRYVATALGELDSSNINTRVIKSLVKALENEDQSTREHATISLIKIGEPAIEELVNLLKKNDIKSQNWEENLELIYNQNQGCANSASYYLPSFHAALALSSIGKSSIPVLVKAFKNQAPVSNQEPYRRYRNGFGFFTLSDYVKFAFLKMDEPAGEIIEILDDNLSDDNPHLQKLILDTFGEIGIEANVAIPELIELLQDKGIDPDVRRRAIYALSELGVEAKLFVPLLINLLQDKETESDVQTTAIYTLREIGTDANSAIPELIAFLQDKNIDSDVQRGAIYALGKLGVEAKLFVPILIDLLQDKGIDPDIQSSALHALGEIGTEAKTAIPALTVFLRDNEQKNWNRRSAVEVLGEMGTEDKSIVPTLIALLQDKEADLWVKESVIDTLVEIGGAEVKTAIPTLIELLQDKEPERDYSLDWWWSVEKGLQEIGRGDQTVVSSLIELLQDKEIEPDVQRTAIGVLGKIGAEDKSVVPTLIELLQDKETDNSVLWSALIALKRIGLKDKTVIPTLIAFLQDKKGDTFVKELAIDVLGKIGTDDKSVVPTLIALLQDKETDNSVLWSAVDALEIIGQKNQIVVPTLIALLQDRVPDENIIYVLKVFKTIGLKDKKTVSILIQLLQDKKTNFSIKRSLINTLGEIGTEDKFVVPTLIALFQDKESYLDVQSLALNALGKIGELDQIAVADVVVLLQDKKADRWVKKSAINALGEIGVEAKTAIPVLINLLQDKETEPYIQSSAINALGKLGVEAKTAIPVLIDLLQDKETEPDVQSSAIYALGEIGAEAQTAIPTLIAFLQDKETESYSKNQKLAAEAIEKIKVLNKENKDNLIQALVVNQNPYLQVTLANTLLASDIDLESLNTNIIPTINDNYIRSYLDRAFREIGGHSSMCMTSSGYSVPGNAKVNPAPSLTPFTWLKPSAVNVLNIQADNLTLEEVRKYFDRDLKKAGYSDNRLFEVEDGFALVTQIERINKDGEPIQKYRWIENKSIFPINPIERIGSLLFEKPGHFRFIAFVITTKNNLDDDFDKQYNTNFKNNKYREFSELLGGRGELPSQIGNQPFTGRKVFALVYHFKKQAGFTYMTRTKNVRDHIVSGGISEDSFMLKSEELQ